jgi:hypothetical protein
MEIERAAQNIESKNKHTTYLNRYQAQQHAPLMPKVLPATNNTAVKK